MQSAFVFSRISDFGVEVNSNPISIGRFYRSIPSKLGAKLPLRVDLKNVDNRRLL